MTRVINIKDAPRGWKLNPDYVYIGRPSPWGNSHILSNSSDDVSREQVCDMFRVDFFSDPMLRDEAVGLLRDKILVCYCKPKRCHGDTIAEYVNLVTRG